MSKRYTYEDVQKFVSEKSDCVLVSTDYTGVFDKMVFRCACGNEFRTDFHHFKTQNQRQCPACGAKKAHRARVTSAEAVNRKLSEIGCELVSVAGYPGRKHPVDIRCSCGHIKRMCVNTALTNNFSGLCTECSDKKFRGQNKFTIDQVRDKCLALGVELVSGEYKGISSPMEFRCSCGRVFTTSFEIVSYYNKTRCDYCTQHMSSGEQKVAAWLDERGIDYTPQKTFEDCGGMRKYRFDFYVPQFNTCIEFDGQQHFKVVDFAGSKDGDQLFNTLLDTVFRDMQKTQYCEEQGIRLIRVRFDEVERISEILSSKLIPR